LARGKDRVVVAWIIIADATGIHHRASEELPGAINRARRSVRVIEVVVAWIVVAHAAGVLSSIAAQNIVTVSLARLSTGESSHALLTRIDVGGCLTAGVLISIAVDDAGAQPSLSSNTCTALVDVGGIIHADIVIAIAVGLARLESRISADAPIAEVKGCGAIEVAIAVRKAAGLSGCAPNAVTAAIYPRGASRHASTVGLNVGWCRFCPTSQKQTKTQSEKFRRNELNSHLVPLVQYELVSLGGNGETQCSQTASLSQIVA
jgi:hypothetical protein